VLLALGLCRREAPRPDRDAATIDSLTTVNATLAARADSLDALPPDVDTVVLTRLRLRTDTLLRQPIALLAPGVAGDTIACWPLPAFRAWQNGLRARIEEERAAANAELATWTVRAEAERNLRREYRTLADSALGVATAVHRKNEQLRRPRVTLAPYVGVGIQSNGTAGLQVGIGLTYQRRRQ
jgi:hypothetical protein